MNKLYSFYSFQNKSNVLWYMSVPELESKPEISVMIYKRVDPQFENLNIYHFAPYNYQKKNFDTLSSSIHSLLLCWLLIEIELTFATYNSASVCRLLLSPSIRTSRSIKFMTNDFVWIMSWCGMPGLDVKKLFYPWDFFSYWDDNILWGSLWYVVMIVWNF